MDAAKHHDNSALGPMEPFFRRMHDRDNQIPFTTFVGSLKQIDTAALDLGDAFDLFFPRFRTERDLSSFITRERGRFMHGDVTFAGDSAAFTARGRERRFAGDATLARRRYHCLQDAPSNDPANNTLLGELFAYAEPRLPFLPELLDSTVDIEAVSAIAARLRWDLSAPCILHIIKRLDNPWFFPPVIGIPPEGAFLRYPLTITNEVIERAVDLRLPNTLEWLFRTFVALETDWTGRFNSGDGTISTIKLNPPETPAEFLRALLSQTLGGGTTFIQGVGAWLRAHGTNALIYPSARSDSLAVVRDGRVTESFGYILVDYRGSPAVDYDPQRYFGALPAWRERLTKPFQIASSDAGGTQRLEITGVQKLQRYRFGAFHNWSRNTLNRAQRELHDGSTHLGAQVQLSLQRPSDIFGPDAEEVLGTDSDFLLQEGGPATGFLVEWIAIHNTVAAFIGSVLPWPVSEYWHDGWLWNGKTWFLHRCSRSRPWAVLKCPVCCVELFWNVADGNPISACLRCNFSNGASNDSDVTDLERWASELRSRRDGPYDDIESLTMYSALCERYPDAVTTIQPPIQPLTFAVIERIAAGFRLNDHWFLQRGEDSAATVGNDIDILCPRCGWLSSWTVGDRDDWKSRCPQCHYPADKPSATNDKKPRKQRTRIVETSPADKPGNAPLHTIALDESGMYKVCVAPGCAFISPLAYRSGRAYLWQFENAARPILLGEHCISGPVYDLALSGDGSWGVIASDEMGVVLIDATNGVRAHEIVDWDADIMAVAVDGKGEIVLLGGRHGEVKAWQRSGRAMLWSAQGHSGRVSQAAVLPDGGRAATAGGGAVTIWDVAAGRSLCAIPLDRACTYLGFSSDGKRLLTAADRIREFDVESGDELAPTIEFLTEHAFVAATERLDLVIGRADRLTLLGAGSSSWPAHRSVRNPSGTINSVGIDRDGTRIVSSTDGGSVSLFCAD